MALPVQSGMLSSSELRENQRSLRIPTCGDTEAEFALKRCTPINFASLVEVCEASEFIYVDASGIEGFPMQIDRNHVSEVIDHRFHGNPSEIFPNARISIEHVGAAATIVVERFLATSIQPSTDIGRLLYGAIHSNTQQLLGSVTTDRDRAAARWLIDAVDIPLTYINEQFTARRNDILSDIEGFIVRESKTYSHKTGDYIIAQLEFLGAIEILAKEYDRLISGLMSLGRRAMLNLVDVSNGQSALIVPDAQLRNTVAAALRCRPTDAVFEFTPGRLRKQIVAALEDHA